MYLIINVSHVFTADFYFHIPNSFSIALFLILKVHFTLNTTFPSPNSSQILDSSIYHVHLKFQKKIVDIQLTILKESQESLDLDFNLI